MTTILPVRHLLLLYEALALDLDVNERDADEECNNTLLGYVCHVIYMSFGEIRPQTGAMLECLVSLPTIDANAHACGCPAIQCLVHKSVEPALLLVAAGANVDDLNVIAEEDGPLAEEIHRLAQNQEVMQTKRSDLLQLRARHAATVAATRSEQLVRRQEYLWWTQWSSALLDVCLALAPLRLAILELISIGVFAMPALADVPLHRLDKTARIVARAYARASVRRI